MRRAVLIGLLILAPVLGVLADKPESGDAEKSTRVADQRGEGRKRSQPRATDKSTSVRDANSKKLFNGTNLDGWTGDEKLWRVKDGVIVGETTGVQTYNTFLYTDAEYANFELRFAVKLRNHNSGVQFRSKVIDPEKFVMAGYQADIAPGYWGLLYEERLRGKLDFQMDTSTLAKPDQWLDFVVRADGPNITITCNGTETVRYTEHDYDEGATTGRIGLQLHAGPPMKVAFKDLVIKELD